MGCAQSVIQLTGLGAEEADAEEVLALVEKSRVGRPEVRPAPPPALYSQRSPRAWCRGASARAPVPARPAPLPLLPPAHTALPPPRSARGPP